MHWQMKNLKTLKKSHTFIFVINQNEMKWIKQNEVQKDAAIHTQNESMRLSDFKMASITGIAW